MGAPRRPPEVKAEEATPYQKYWLATGMEVRPFKWDADAGHVLCSREISPGHRKRDFRVKFGTILFTTPPLKAAVPPPAEFNLTGSAKPDPRGLLSDSSREEIKVPTGGTPLPSVIPNAPADEALRRLMALHALKVALEAVLSENTSRKWSYFLIACQLNPELRVMKHMMTQAELDVRSVDGQMKEIMDTVRGM